MKTLKTTVCCLLLCIMAISCSSSEDDLQSEPEKTQSFRVKAEWLWATQFPSTEGAELEVYGKVGTQLIKGNFTEDRVLWERDRDNWVGVGNAQTTITSQTIETVLTFTEEEIANDARIGIYAELWDRDPDGNPDDFLGNESQSSRVFVYLQTSNLLTEHNLGLTEFSGINMVVRISVEELSANE
jgi:hypothetical protein